MLANTRYYLIAQEIVHSMIGRGKKGFMSLKLGMENNFDKIEWYFLINILHCLGFNLNQIKMIEECISLQKVENENQL